MTNDKLQKGYTLIELLVSIGILIILFALISINISNLTPNSLETAAMDGLISDIRSQQTLSMTNDNSYGVHFESGSYTLFTGPNYVANAASNFVVALDSGITFSNVTFPNSVIVFSPGSGDVAGYTAGLDSFTLGNTESNKLSVAKINKYGATY